MADLPAWVVDDRASVAAEAAPYRGLTAAQRSELLSAACRAAARQLANRADRERILAYRDPLPPSSVAILHRLRDEQRERQPGDPGTKEGPDFILTPSEAPGAVWSCWTRARLPLTSSSEEDCMLVWIDPPMRAVWRPGDGPGKELDQVVLCPRHRGYGLFPIVDFPVWVHVMRLLDDSAVEAGELRPEQLGPLFWGVIDRAVSRTATNDG